MKKNKDVPTKKIKLYIYITLKINMGMNERRERLTIWQYINKY